MTKRIHISLITLFVIYVYNSNVSIAQQTPYGNCESSAQQYQSRYEQFGNVSDLVCMQYALERELGVVSDLSPSESEDEPKSVTQPNIDRSLSRNETYCMSQQQGPGTLTKCLIKQERASTEITEFIEKHVNRELAQSRVSDCTGYSTGWRGLGSMENIDQVPIAECIKLNDPSAIFEACIRKVTKSAPKGNSRFWDRDESEKIASCFNTTIKK